MSFSASWWLQGHSASWRGGSGWSDGWVRSLVDAHDRSDLRIALLVARLLRTRTASSLIGPAALCVLLMIGFTVVSQHAVSPKMAALRVQMGSIQATAADIVRCWRSSVDCIRISISLESAVLLAGIVAIYLMIKELSIAS